MAIWMKINDVDQYGRTLLHDARHPEITKYLIENGANVNAEDHDGRTPLHTCSCPDSARLLILNGADVNAEDKDWNTPLDYLKLRCSLIEVAGILKAHMEDNETKN